MESDSVPKGTEQKGEHMKQITQEELKNIQVNILDRVKAFCDANEIEYFLFAGTLLGAVRHKGYIPWDDDIDICMRRKDYDRFFEVFNTDRKDGLRAIDYKNEKGYYLASGKVIDDRTIMQETTNFDKKIGVYIDVFPLDDLPENVKELRRLDRKIKPYRNMLLLKIIKPNGKRSWYKDAILKMGGGGAETALDGFFDWPHY